MRVITASNVNTALPQAMRLLLEHGDQLHATRGGPTVEYPEPVATVYEHPCERVLIDPIRDANPFFHFFEALWILGGRKDVGFLSHFLPKIREYSDDGETFYGAYGYRLRVQFGFDQINFAIRRLRQDKVSRQVVLSIWEPKDLMAKTKDLPCNDTIFLKIRDGKLNMRVACRSNDAIWGAYGANVVQFSTLLEYIAAGVGVEVGKYTQISDSFHVYESNPYWQYVQLNAEKVLKTPTVDPYDEELHYEGVDALYSVPLINGDEERLEDFDADLKRMFEYTDKHMWLVASDPGLYTTNYFQTIVAPMLAAHTLFNQSPKPIRIQHASAALHRMPAECDWREAAMAWVKCRGGKN